MTFISYNFHSAGPRILIFFAVLFSFSLAAFAQNPVSGKQPAESGVVVKKCWSFATPESGLAAVAGDSRMIFMASFSGDVSAVDAVSGEKLWTSELGGTVVSGIAFDEKNVYAATNSGNADALTAIRTLSRDTGITIWTASIPRSEKVFLLSDADAVIAVSNVSITRFGSAKGEIQWQKELSAEPSAAPIISDGIIFYAADDGKIGLIDAASGAVKGSNELPTNAVFLGGSENGGILLSDDRGNLTKWTAGHTASWQFKAGARITKAVRTKEGILAASDDNFVYMIWDYNGDVTWKIRLSGRVNDIAVITDDLAAATAVGESEVFILDLGKGRAATRIGGANGDPPVGKIFAADDGKLVSASDAAVVLHSLNGCENSN